MNQLMIGSPYEKTDLIASVMQFEQNYKTHMDRYFMEMMKNFKKVAGYIYSEADLTKLEREKRPAFVYNLIVPYLLRLAGSYMDNQSRVEAQPRTPDDFNMAVIMTDLLDYSHYTANNISRELGLAFIFAAIGRVGWVGNEWSYFNDDEGMNFISCQDPFSIMWDGSFTRRDLRTTRALIKRAWLTPEEMIAKYARKDDNMAEEITEKAKMYLGTDRQDRLLRYVERTFGANLTYKGDDQGYDSVTNIVDGMLYNNGNYFDSFMGAFKVVQAHERRNETMWVMYDHIGNQEYNITKFIEAEGRKKFNNEKMQLLREQFDNPKIHAVDKEIIYQTDICPAYNMAFYDKPYEVQNGLFKDTPVFCFDFGTESIEWKGYVDLIGDAVASFNLTQNTNQTLLMKLTHGETWYEEGALVAGKESDFLDNRIGKKVEVADRAISGSKIKQIMPAPPSPGLLQNLQINQQLIEDMTGLGQNSQGKQETKGESGVLFAQRIQQSEKMMNWVLDNVVSQQVVVGKNTKDLMRKYLTPGRVVKLVGDEKDFNWIEINQDAIRKITYNEDGEYQNEQLVPGNISTSDYDIVLSKAPFGEFAKQQEFQQVMILAEFYKSVDPALVPLETIAKVSTSRYKQDFINKIREKDQQRAIEMQQRLEGEQQLQQAGKEKMQQDQQKELDSHEMDMRNKALDAEKKIKELNAPNMVSDAVSMATK